MSEHMPHGHLVFRAYEDSPLVANRWRYDEHEDGTVLRYEQYGGYGDGWSSPERVPWVGY